MVELDELGEVGTTRNEVLHIFGDGGDEDGEDEVAFG